LGGERAKSEYEITSVLLKDFQSRYSNPWPFLMVVYYEESSSI
jgi:hypothetical protein